VVLARAPHGAWLRLVVDTGTSVTVLSPQAAARAGAATDGRRFEMRGIGGLSPMAVATVDLDIGGVQVDNAGVGVGDLAWASLDGILSPTACGRASWSSWTCGAGS